LLRVDKKQEMYSLVDTKSKKVLVENVSKKELIYYKIQLKEMNFYIDSIMDMMTGEPCKIVNGTKNMNYIKKIKKSKEWYQRFIESMLNEEDECVLTILKGKYVELKNKYENI